MRRRIFGDDVPGSRRHIRLTGVLSGMNTGKEFDAPPEQIRTDSDTIADKENILAAPTGDEPPDGGYGWVCVACVFLINAHTWGLNSV